MRPIILQKEIIYISLRLFIHLLQILIRIIAIPLHLIDHLLKHLIYIMSHLRRGLNQQNLLMLDKGIDRFKIITIFKRKNI